MTEHTPIPWKLCGADGRHFCGHIWSADGNSHIVTVISGEWGDSYPSLRFVEETGGVGSLGPKIEAYNDIIAYGEIPEDIAKANARFIVTACNCHADLLEALKKVGNWAPQGVKLDENGEFYCYVCGNHESIDHHPDCYLPQVDEAIRKADEQA